MDMQDRKARIGGIFALAHTLLLALEMPESADMRDRMACVTAIARMLATFGSNTALALETAHDATKGLFQGAY